MYTYRAEALKIVDGDTCSLLLDLGCDVHLKVRVRLYGVNTPEIHGVAKDSEEYRKGIEAQQFLARLIMNRELIVKTYKTKHGSERRGKYGRYLAEIWVREDYPDKPSVNQRLLDGGYGVPYFGGKR